MTIAYLKKASKTPATGTDETRRVVTEMLSNIEQGGEAEALRYGRELDGYEGEAIIGANQIADAGKLVSETLKDDIQFAFDRVTRFAHAQRNLFRLLKPNCLPAYGQVKNLFQLKQLAVMCLAAAMPMWRLRSCL